MYRSTGSGWTCTAGMVMSEQKKREDYPDDYSYRAENLWRLIADPDDLKYPKVISYFCKQNGTPVSGKVFTPPEPVFKCEVDIKKCFAAIKEQMVTKSGQPRATMLKLAEYEITAWASILEYLRSSWQEGERGKVLLTYKEYFMLFPSKVKKK